MPKTWRDEHVQMCSSTERAARIVEAARGLRAPGLRRLLGDWWNACDGAGDHWRELYGLFCRAGYTSDTTEVVALPCTIYRAHYVPAGDGYDPDAHEGLSWTLRFDVAERFADYLESDLAAQRGITRRGREVQITGATCERILGYFVSRDEAEVIPDLDCIDVTGAWSRRAAE